MNRTFKVHSWGEEERSNMNGETKYKCLSIRQPLAWAICVGEKTVENKPQNAHYRGLLLIHAGKNAEGLADLKEAVAWKTHKPCFALGAIIGAAELHNVVEFNRSLEANVHANGPYCYLLRNAKWFEEPIPCTGQLGLFGLPEQLTAQVAKQLNKPGKTVQIPDELLRAIRPSPTDACCYQGQHYLDNGLPEEALRRFMGAITLDKSNAHAYFLKSIALDQLERTEEAVKDVSEAIRLDRDNPDYFAQRGVYYRTLKRLHESTHDFAKVISLEPDEVRGYVFRSINHHLCKDDVSAFADLDKAQKRDPDDMAATLLKGAFLVESGRIAAGIEQLKEAERQCPDDPWPSYVLYCAYKKAMQGGLAAAAFDRFNEKDGDEDEARSLLEQVGCSQ
jgi:tetratricopeptide (TPR) repeat protein